MVNPMEVPSNILRETARRLMGVPYYFAYYFGKPRGD
jgi:hypothetical protein